MADNNDARIRITDDGMQACLTVAPDDPKDRITLDAVLERLNRVNVTFGIRYEELKDELVQTLTAVKESQEERRILVAEGQPPQPATAERFEPAGELSLPRELRNTAKQLIRRAGAPRARRLVEETVEVRRQTGRTGLFGVGREQWETVPEKRTREVAGRVPLRIRDVRLVTRDTVVGRIIPGGRGTPGRTVENRRIFPEKPSDPWFYLGDYLRREGRQLVAEASGFLRIGPNWADVVPYEPHRWNLSFNQDMADCLLTFRPGEDADNRPTAETVVAEAQRKGYPAYALKSRDEIDELLESAMYHYSTLNAISISTRVDAFIDIEISHDRDVAYLHLIKGRGGGRALKMQDIGRAIRRSGIKTLQRERIQRDLTEFRRSAALELRSYKLAEGTPPGQGPDPAVEFSLRDLPETERKRMISLLEENPELAGGNPGFDEFPPDAIESVAPVEADQHVLTVVEGVPGKPGVDVFGKEIPGKPGPRPRLHLFGALKRKGDFVLAGEDGVVDRCRRPGHIYLRVRPNRDVAVRISVSKDRLSALLSVTPHLGTGHALDRETIEQVLREKSIVEGIREQGIEEALVADRTGTHPTVNSSTPEQHLHTRTVLVARGRIATPDGRPVVQFFTDRTQSSVGRQHGTAAARADDNRQETAVFPGQPLAAVLHKTQTGYCRAVDGEQMQPITEPANTLHAGENVSARDDTDGAVLLFAAANGRVQIEETTVHVITTRVISGDVDMNSGNIRFPSAVTISGSVRTGFAVIADGDVTVSDTVEAALVSAEGTLTICGGVKGGGKAVLRSRSGMSARFIERSRVFSVGRLSVDTGIHHCSVKCNDRIVCRGHRSRIAGGEIKTRFGLEVQDLGSRKGTATKVSFGQDYVVEHRISEIERKLTADQQKLVDIDTRMEHASGAGLARLQREKAKLLKRIERSSVHLFTLREKFEEHAESELLVHGTLFPGVTLESHGRVREIQAEETNVRLTFDRDTGKIQSSRLDT